MESLEKRVLPYLETHIVDHCNLNCKACSHYCNITKPNFIKIEDFEKDIKELSKKFDIYQIRLMGGEPLLAKNINDFLKITRIYFPQTDLRIVTNGILLSKQTEDFWNTIKENNILIDLTKYPIGGTSFSDAMDIIGAHLIEVYREKEFGFYVQKNSLGKLWIAGHFQLTMDSRGTSDINFTFKNCPLKRCVNLINGKLTHCPTAGYLHNYNSYFHKNLAAEKGIDIYKYSPEEILEYLSSPIETCKYCVFDEKATLIKWEKSKRNENEWFIDKIK